MALLIRLSAVVIFFAAFTTSGFAEKRVALVIGNSDYDDPRLNLENPKNDAADLAAALHELGFDVTERANLKAAPFDNTVAEFADKANDADIALFFYAGHGLQVYSRSFLMPVDAKLETEAGAVRELVAIQDVVSKIENAAKVSIVIIDACRDNPLADDLRRRVKLQNRDAKAAEGLAPISVIGSNTLVVYSTVPGEVAQDGDGRNSPFAAALLARIKTPGLEVEQMFKRVTADVLNATGGKQQPERLSRLQTEVVLLASQSDAATQLLREPKTALGKPEFYGTESAERLYVVTFDNKTTAFASPLWNEKGVPASDYSGYVGRQVKADGPYFDIEVTEVSYNGRTADLKDDCTGGAALKRLKAGDIVRMKPQNCTSTTVTQAASKKVFFATQAP